MTIAEAAIVRARYRRLMMLRWRNPELRSEDKRFKRLPADWHDWMGCPADDGYQHLGCTCDSWLDRDRRPTPHPKAVAERERQERARLEREIHVHRQQTLAKAAAARPPRGAVWVKTIDPNILQHTLPLHGVEDPAKALDEDLKVAWAGIARRAAARRQRSDNGSASRPRRIIHMGLREPAWSVAARCHLSRMRTEGGFQG